MTQAAHALSITPTRIVIDPETAPRALIWVTADEGGPVPLTVELFERVVDFEGRETLRSVDEGTLQVLPPQRLLESGERAAFEVVWSTDRARFESRSFYLSITELNLLTARPEDQVSVEIAATYTMSIHIAGKAEANLNSTLIGPTSPGDGLQLLIENKGEHYALMSDYDWDVAGLEGVSAVVDGTAIAQAAKTDAVLPGGRVSVSLIDAGLPSTLKSASPISVQARLRK